MLVLTRKRNESILIGNDIRITILEFRDVTGGKPRVRVGIDAPKGIPIHREEIAEKYRDFHPPE